MEENNSFNLAYIKNLSPTTFSTNFTIPVDLNANVDKILSVDCSFNERKIDVSNSKAAISGKVTVKVVYLDTDGIINSICSSQAVSENVVNDSITSNSVVQITNIGCSTDAVSEKNVIKVECKITMYLLMAMNIAFAPCVCNSENIITKQNEVQTHSLIEGLNTSFEHTINFETKDQIVKILSYNAVMNIDEITSKENLAIISGTLIGEICYETDGDLKIKTIKEKSTIKQDIEIKNLKENDILKLNVFIEKNCDDFEISTEGEQIVTVQNRISVSGIILRPTEIQMICDAFSTTNNLTLTNSTRNILINSTCNNSQIEISNETTLNEEDNAIDEVISNLISSKEITNIYNKDDSIFVEGVVVSSLIYVDENKIINSKIIETPFVVDTKITHIKDAELFANLTILNCRAKARRGTIIEIDYDANISVCQFEQDNISFIDNIEIGDVLNFGDFDFQIFIAKENETIWDLAKRIKISPDTLVETNPKLPTLMQGGEKVIIRR